ncbi:MAG TPA: hypothetical protein VGJ26_17000, partial [Pirellulales bacterium]
MQLQIVQATILGLAAMTLCGCSSGVQWPWSKKTAAVSPASTDPALVGAAAAAGAYKPPQVAQNPQLPSAQSGPYTLDNSYAPAPTMPPGYGGVYPEAAPATHSPYPPAGAPGGYNTASMNNAPPGGAYPSTGYPAASGPTTPEGQYAAASGYETPVNPATAAYGAAQPNAATTQPYGGGASPP